MQLQQQQHCGAAFAAGPAFALPRGGPKDAGSQRGCCPQPRGHNKFAAAASAGQRDALSHISANLRRITYKRASLIDRSKWSSYKPVACPLDIEARCCCCHRGGRLSCALARLGQTEKKMIGSEDCYSTASTCRATRRLLRAGQQATPCKCASGSGDGKVGTRRASAWPSGVQSAAAAVGAATNATSTATAKFTRP